MAPIPFLSDQNHILSSKNPGSQKWVPRMLEWICKPSKKSAWNPDWFTFLTTANTDFGLTKYIINQPLVVQSVYCILCSFFVVANIVYDLLNLCFICYHYMYHFCMLWAVTLPQIFTGGCSNISLFISAVCSWAAHDLLYLLSQNEQPTHPGLWHHRSVAPQTLLPNLWR